MLKSKLLKNKLWRALLGSAVVGCIYKLISVVVYEIVIKSFTPEHPGNKYDLEPSDLINHEPFLKELDLYWEARGIFYDYAAIVLSLLALLLFILLCLFAFRDMTRKEIFKSSMLLVFYSFVLYNFSRYFHSINFSGRNFFPAFTVFDDTLLLILILPLYILGEAAFLYYYGIRGWIIYPYLSYSGLFEFIIMILPLTFAVFARHRKNVNY